MQGRILSSSPKARGQQTGRSAGLTRAWGLLLAVVLLFLSITGLCVQVLAQPATATWAEPVNLSRSGAASEPVIIVLPDGTLRVLWWDQFEGLMVARGPVPVVRATEVATTTESAPGGPVWSDPISAPILAIRAGQQSTVPTPIEVMPLIVGDAAGRAQAFWRGEADKDTGDQPLQYSRLAPGQTSWSGAQRLAVAAAAFDATADLSGTLHLAYVQPAQVGSAPSGLYYRRSPDGGASWSAPTPIQQSRYLRLLPAGGDVVRLTAHDAVSLTVTWQDPRNGQTLVARSPDGGATWQEPRPFAASDGAPLRQQVVAVPGQPGRLLWPLGGVPETRLAASSRGDALVLALWDGERWAATRRLDPDLLQPDVGLELSLTDLDLALAPLVPREEGAGGSLVVAGIDPQGDLWITGSNVEALAGLLSLPAGSTTEREATGQAGAVNLSQSGAASAPAIAAGQDGRLHAFWWDQFDGLLAADGVVSASSVTSGTEEVVALSDSWSEPRPVPLPADVPVARTPWILSDADGRVHAFWRQVPEQPVAGEAVIPRLEYSQLAADGSAWSPPVVLAESTLVYDVVADRSGALHLAYLVTQETPASPAGVYYRRTGDDGASWTAPALVDTSRYLRLLPSESAHLRLAADGAGEVYVTWDDPRLERSLLAHSPDGGATWQAPVEVGDPDTDAGSQRARLVVPQRGEALVLWEPRQAGGICNLYQAPAEAVLDANAGDGQRVLVGLTDCPGDEQFLPLAAGQVLMMAGTGSEALTLALWDGKRWSEPTRWGQSFEDAGMGGSVYLGDLHAALVQVPGLGADRATGSALVGLGTDGAGDVWATGSQEGELEMVFAEPPPWSVPVSFHQSEVYPGLPTVALDSEGTLHALWTEGAGSPEEPGTALSYARWDGTQWTRPAAVLQSPEGKADEPDLVAVGDRLHAVWSGGQGGEVLYSRAFVGDAHNAGGWSEPVLLPAPSEIASQPDLTAGPDGTLHVVYSVPVNEGRGIYYTRSRDGEEWSEARPVFDAAAAGWAMSDNPGLAVDLEGTIHVVWLRADLFGTGLNQLIAYAQSKDGGETWSEPVLVAEGAYGWPQVVASGGGQVHLLWSETTTPNGWRHQWSEDGGLGWTRPEGVSGFGNVRGPVGFMADAGAALHLVGLGYDGRGEPALFYMAWDGQRWGERETFGLELPMSTPVAGVSVAILPALGRLDVVFRGEGKDDEGTRIAGLWQTERAVQSVAATPGPTTLAPRPTQSAQPTAAPTLVPTPAPSYGQAPPPNSGSGMTDLLPVLLPLVLAGLLVAGAFGVGLFRKSRGTVQVKATVNEAVHSWRQRLGRWARRLRKARE